jgi:hypothetical protein
VSCQESFQTDHDSRSQLRHARRWFVHPAWPQLCSIQPHDVHLVLLGGSNSLPGSAIQHDAEGNATQRSSDYRRTFRSQLQHLTESTKEPPEKRKATEVSTEEERSPEETQENLENVEVDPIAPGEDAESSDHIEKVQKKKKNFTCKRCSTGFRTNGGLKNHLKSRMCYKRIWEILRKKSLAHETSVNTQTIQMP